MNHSPVVKMKAVICPICKAKGLRYNIVAHCDTCGRTFLPSGAHPEVTDGYAGGPAGFSEKTRRIIQNVEVLGSGGKTERHITMSWDLD